MGKTGLFKFTPVKIKSHTLFIAGGKVVGWWAPKHQRSSWLPAAPIKHVHYCCCHIKVFVFYSSLDPCCRKKKKKEKKTDTWWASGSLLTPPLLGDTLRVGSKLLRLLLSFIDFRPALIRECSFLVFLFAFFPLIWLAILLHKALSGDDEDCGAVGRSQTHWYRFVLQHKHLVPLASSTFRRPPSL